MNQDINQKIAALQNHAVEYQKKVREERNPEKVSQLQGEFAAYISSEMGQMIKDGASASDIQKIQDILRAAFEPVPDSHAKDVDENLESDVYDEEDLLNYEPMTFLIPVDFALIQNVENGTLNKEDFFDKLSKVEHLGFFDEMLEIADLIVNNYDAEKSIFGGEVIVLPDNEALVINPLLFKQENEVCNVIADPAVYQTELEVEEISNTLSNISEKDLCKKFDIKKLIEADVFVGYDEKEVKKAKEEIEKSALDTFKQLSSFYKNANKKCVIIINI